MDSVQIKNKYSKKKIAKVIFSVLAVVGISLLFFHGNCFADDMQKEILNISQMISSISQFVYVLIWPVLVIAGAALDNSLIYGSFLNLDVALWNLWNIMKNFANFALGFLFIFSIVKTLFNSIGIGQKSGGDNPMTAAKTTVTNTLLAGIFIQLSWFVVAMLIDLSTVLIYSVGGLPISMLSDMGGTQGQNVQTLSDTPILKLNTRINDGGGGEVGISSYYSYGEYNFSPCYIPKSIGGSTAEYIVGRKYRYLTGQQEFLSGHCTVGGTVYTYVENVTGFLESDDYCFTGDHSKCLTNSGYFNLLENYVGVIDSGTATGLKHDCVFVSLWGDENTASGGNCTGYGMLSFTGGIFSGYVATGFTLSSLLENAKSYIGPFVTLYSSILGYGEFMNGIGSTSTLGGFFSLLLNAFFVGVLFIPVAILMILLIIRVGFLWVVIAISPLLVLLQFFGNEGGPLKGLSNNEILKKFSLPNILKQIFGPVLVVFAISMSIVFLTAIASTMPKQDEASQEANTPLLSAFGITPECDEGNKTKCEYNILGLVSIKIDVQDNNYHKDVFVWCLLELLCTGIVWFFLKFAISFMSEGTGAKLMESSQNLLKNVPIVPLPGGGAVGINALQNNVGLSKSLNRISNRMQAQQQKDIDEALPWLNGVTPTETTTSPTGTDVTAAGVGTASIVEIVNKIQKNDITDLSGLNGTERALMTSIGYGDQQKFDSFKKIITDENYTKLLKDNPPTEGATIEHTNSDAINLSKEQLDVAVKTDKSWAAWASGMVSGSVQTSTGVFMVDYLGGTPVVGSEEQQYEIVTRDEYESRHFGDTQRKAAAEKGEQAAYNERLDAYLKELQEELKELEELQKKTERDTKQNNQFNSLTSEENGVADINIETLRQKLGISDKEE